MIAVLAVVFLVVVVIFALSQSLTISTSNIVDSKQQRDSVAALFLAESGFESALRKLSVAAQSGTIADTDCTGIKEPPGSPPYSYSLGGGNFSYRSANSTPTICGGSGQPACTNCYVEAVGSLPSASRTIGLNMALGLQNGVAGFGGTTNSSPAGINLAVTNFGSNPGAVVFNLAWRRQGSDGQTTVTGGQANSSICTGCGLSWNIESSSGAPSVGSMGVFDAVDPNFSAVAQQFLDKERNYAEVGAVFVSATGTPGITPTGSYWNDEGGAGGGTSTTGATGVNEGMINNGALTFGTQNTVPGSAEKQTGTSWCYGADTLVAGFSGRSSSMDTLSSFMFGPTSLPLTPIAALPHPAADIYSEIWYTHNPDYFSSTTPGVPENLASSYPRMVIGTIGANFTANRVMKGDTTMTVTSVSSGRLSVGDRVPALTGSSGQVLTISSGPGEGLDGIYVLSASSNVNNVRPPSTESSILVVTATTNALTLGPIQGSGVTPDPNVNGIGSGSPPTTYTVVTPTTTSGSMALTQGASGSTIYLPAGASLPQSDTIIAVWSGAGSFDSGTKVTGTPDPVTRSFTINKLPAIPLAGATICGGICAFFNHDPSVDGGMTRFTVVKGSGTTQWAAGFTCLAGVSNAVPRPVTSVKVQPTTWSELY